MPFRAWAASWSAYTVATSGSCPSGPKKLLVNERVQPRHAAIAFFEEVRSRVVERLTCHSTSPPASGYVVHALEFARDRVAVVREVFANLRSRSINTVAAHNPTARMNPNTVFGETLREQRPTLDGIELDKNLVEVPHEQFSCVHKMAVL